MERIRIFYFNMVEVKVADVLIEKKLEIGLENTELATELKFIELGH